jgi:hypothetical protein
MASTTDLHSTQIVLSDENTGSGSSYGTVEVSRNEHFGGEVDFFISARDFVGEGPDLTISVEDAQNLYAWLGRQLGK